MSPTHSVLIRGTRSADRDTAARCILGDDRDQTQRVPFPSSAAEVE
jgi:hypothetical protein